MPLCCCCPNWRFEICCVRSVGPDSSIRIFLASVTVGRLCVCLSCRFLTPPSVPVCLSVCKYWFGSVASESTTSPHADQKGRLLWLRGLSFFSSSSSTSSSSYSTPLIDFSFLLCVSFPQSLNSSPLVLPPPSRPFLPVYKAS